MHTSALVLVRGGVASAKVLHARRVAQEENRFVVDCDYIRRAGLDVEMVVKQLLRKGPVIVADTFQRKADLVRLAALSSGTIVLEMQLGQLPPDWEAYPDAIPVMAP